MAKSVAIYGGGFKPPTKGHFEVVQQALKQLPDVEDFIVYVGSGTRDGLTQAEAILIWEIYQSHLPMKVKIEPSKAPVGSIYSYAKDNPEDEVYWVLGAREGKDEDAADIVSRTAAIDKKEDKYNNVEVKIIQTADKGMSGTNARQASKVSPEEFYKYLPDELSDEEREEVYNIVKPAIQEMLNENASYSKDIDYKSRIKDLTVHMLKKGWNIVPLPKIVYKDGDVENAREFLGKTAYYDPNTQTIVLYTEGRHPKDIVRSYAHEMVHHQQNIEGRLNNIQTTNTQEDDQLNDIEAEANLKGTMTFRNWTDSLQEKKKVKDPFGLNAYALELARGLEESFLENVIPKKDEKAAPHGSGYKKINEGMYDSIVTKVAGDITNAWVSQFKEDPTRLFSLLDTNYELQDKKERPLEFDLIAKIDFKKTKDRKYKVDGGANAGDDESEGFIALSFQVDPRELPKMWSTITMDIRDVLRHEIEHLTQGGWNVRQGKEMDDDQFIRDLIQKYKTLAPKNYFMLDKEVDAMLQGMYFKAKKSRRPFDEVIEDYLNMVGLDPEEKEEVKDRWRTRRKALSLPLFENEQVMDYEIYSDMDGVLTDFDAAFEKVSGGIPPRTYETKYGKDKFWEIVDAKGVGYWVGMPWMSDGKQYWDYIKEYKPILLSSPSRSETSRLGKRLWVRNQLPGTKLILAQAKDKQNYARKNRILIDDRESNIDEWRAQGGIGILHTSAADTIRQLKELGL